MSDIIEIELVSDIDLIEVFLAPFPKDFSGSLTNITETSALLVISSGAVSVDFETVPNVLGVPSLIENTVITFTGDLIIDKYETLKTIPDTGGPWTLDIVANGKTINLVRNGSGTADEELFELWADGTDIISPDAGGLTASKGT